MQGVANKWLKIQSARNRFFFFLFPFFKRISVSAPQGLLNPHPFPATTNHSGLTADYTDISMANNDPLALMKLILSVRHLIGRRVTEHVDLAHRWHFFPPALSARQGVCTSCLFKSSTEQSKTNPAAGNGAEGIKQFGLVACLLFVNELRWFCVSREKK